MKNMLKTMKNKSENLIARISIMFSALAMSMYCPVSANSQGIVTGTSDDIFKKFIGAILDLTTYVGVGLLVWGLISFFLAMRNEEGEKKTAAIWNIVAGIGIITIKTILVGVGINI